MNAITSADALKDSKNPTLTSSNGASVKDSAPQFNVFLMIVKALQDSKTATQNEMGVNAGDVQIEQNQQVALIAKMQTAATNIPTATSHFEWHWYDTLAVVLAVAITGGCAAYAAAVAAGAAAAAAAAGAAGAAAADGAAVAGAAAGAAATTGTVWGAGAAASGIAVGGMVGTTTYSMTNSSLQHNPTPDPGANDPFTQLQTQVGVASNQVSQDTSEYLDSAQQILTQDNNMIESELASYTSTGASQIG